ncbi:hypothetical protein SUGI_0579970 [Cryptomeria japonica]|nr:hypothetical protein SUGI_0579970 [Cryptomeria japonica]
MESQQLQREFPASEIANEFVNQYYCVLNNCPDKIYQFYKDCSTITRPEPNGQLVHVETLEAMKNKIVSMLNEGIEVKIGSVDSQEAFNESYIILVTGVILGHDNVERKFAQSFLLAPQERGYFVLNDAFRYLEESQYSEEKTLLVNDVCDEPLQEEIVPAKKIQGFESQPSKLENKHATETVEKTTSPPEETRKMSFLSVLLKENPHPIQMPTVVVKFPINTGLKANVPSQSSNSNSTVRSRKAPVNENSIHLRNLPWNSTITLLEEEFKKYGSIKPGGIQIRANKEKNFCYGFIEFQSSTSVDSAIKTSPIVISGRRVYVEKKRLAGLRETNASTINSIHNMESTQGAGAARVVRDATGEENKGDLDGGWDVMGSFTILLPSLSLLNAMVEWGFFSRCCSFFCQGGDVLSGTLAQGPEGGMFSPPSIFVDDLLRGCPLQPSLAFVCRFCWYALSMLPRISPDCLIEVALPYSKAKKDGVGDNFSPIEVELSATMQIGRYWRMVGVVLFLDYWGYRGDLSLGYLGYGGLPKPFSPAKRNGFFLSCWTLF